MPNDVEQMLRQVPTSDRVRAVAFDAVYNMDDATAEQALRALPLPDELKATLWDKRSAHVAPQPTATPPPAGATKGMLAPSTPEGDPQTDGAGRGVMSDEEWATLTPGDKARNILKWGGNAIASMTGMGTAGYDAVEHPGLTLATAALPGGVNAAASLPTRAKAGAKFQQVLRAVGDEPVDVARPGDSALRIYQLSERGASMPKAVRDFLKRATDPSKADMSYKEARDFYSNLTSLSADETRRMSRPIRRELNELRVALDKALAQTAAGGGQEQVYREAMREYAIASRMRELSDKALKYGAGVAGAGAAYNFMKD
jgi:hypothetical protein